MKVMVGKAHQVNLLQCKFLYLAVRPLILRLGQVLYKCRQQVIKSFLFYLGNIKVLRRWLASLENEVPPSPFLMQLSYRCDLKEPCL